MLDQLIVTKPKQDPHREVKAAKQKGDNKIAYQFKYIMVGDPGVGKSALLYQFTERRFRANYSLTIGVEIVTRLVEVESGTDVKIRVFDTAGEEKFQSIARQYYRGAICVFLVYDITERKSFIHLQKWIDLVNTNASAQT